MSATRLKVSKGQYVLAAAAAVALLALGISSVIESRDAGNRTQLLSNAESPAASIIFTQRETLVYSTRLALWSNGGTTRRDVQIARALLAQRLAVVDTSGKSMGSRANAAYWRALKRADEIVAAAPMGILPEKFHPEINTELHPVIDAIVEEARNLVVSYQKSVDQEMRVANAEIARRDSLNLGLLYLFIICGGLFLFFNTRMNYRNYREIRGQIETEQLELERLRGQLIELQDLDTAKNALISNVNHELRTPLTSIMGYIELMQRDNPDAHSEEHKNHLAVVQRNSEILLRLVESLLSLSKFDSASGKLPNEPVSVREIIEDALFTLRPSTEKMGIEISTLLDSELFVRGDRAQLNQVLINLLANAIKFSPSKSLIDVKVHRLNDVAEISICDPGIGISKEDLPHVFQRFYRGKNSHSVNFEGTGLGLAIVDQVIRHHGGKIQVISELNNGSTFTLALPLFNNGEDNG
jgi:signal transduction histidine kinase